MNHELPSLTSQELDLLADKELMPAKQSLFMKLEKHLAILSEKLKIVDKDFLPEEVLKSSPKISKGENYNSQPYRVLDYPRAFSGKDIFTFRTLILWGHEIGFHLILGGKYKEEYQARISENLGKLSNGFCFSIQDTPWVWEADADGLVKVADAHDLLIQKHLSGRLFIKISYYIDFKDYRNISNKGISIWEELLRSLWR